MGTIFRRNGNIIHMNGHVKKGNSCPCLDGYCIGYFCDLGETDDPRPDFHLMGWGENGLVDSYTFPAVPFMGEVGKVYVIPFRQAWYGARINGLRLHLICMLPDPEGSGFHLFLEEDGLCSIHATAEEAQAIIDQYTMFVLKNTEMDRCELVISFETPEEEEFE